MFSIPSCARDLLHLDAFLFAVKYLEEGRDIRAVCRGSCYPAGTGEVLSVPLTSLGQAHGSWILRGDRGGQMTKKENSDVHSCLQLSHVLLLKSPVERFLTLIYLLARAGTLLDHATQVRE